MNNTRRTKEERRKQEIIKELENLVSDMNLNVDALIVEGSHDKRTLKTLGYKKTILLCSKISDSQLSDIIARNFSTIAILTDFDEEGKNMNKTLTTQLERSGVKIDSFFRKRFCELIEKTRIRTIEGIYRLKIALFPF